MIDIWLSMIEGNEKGFVRFVPVFICVLLSVGMFTGCATTGLADYQGNIRPANEITILLPGDVPLVLVRIPAGTFIMGAYENEVGSNTDEYPQHEVVISQDFYMGKYEVTQQQWVAAMGSWPGIRPSSKLGLGSDYPAYYVSWDNVQMFINSLNDYIARSGQGTMTFRLPSEAEWEYACRAGAETRFYWGDDAACTDIDYYAWYRGNSTNQTHPVGGKLPNPFGLYDMSGNVWELCEDDYRPDYTNRPGGACARVDNPRGIHRVDRGGSWQSLEVNCRSADRGSALPHKGYEYVGFRIVGQ